MKKYIPYAVILILLVIIFAMPGGKQTRVVERHTSDTVLVHVIDTFFCDRPTFIHEVVKDTVYIQKDSENGLKLPLKQRFYSTSKYQAWVSGFEPFLDSIRTFNDIEYRYINNTVTREVYPKKTDFFVNMESMFIKNKLSPNIGLSVKFRNDLVLGGKIGYYDHSAYYGVSVGYKLNR